ncbi:MAG: flavin monoamine oxidase family protein [Rhodothermales bacterium]
MKRTIPNGRTPLFSAVRRALHAARHATNPAAPPADEGAEMRRAQVRSFSRRHFLKVAGAASLAVGASGCSLLNLGQPGSGRDEARVAIVGGGIAGLNAAYTFKKAGLKATVYEASRRTGGRIVTAHGALAPGLYTERGGEFIDSDHEDMLALASEFGLELVDLHGPSQAGLTEGYFFNGRHYTEAEVIEAFRPLAPQIEADLQAMGDSEDPAILAVYDVPLSEYLERIGASGFIRELLEVAYVTEYGLDAAETSAINLIWLIGTDTSEGFEVFGESDERFKVKGGNQQIVDELARRLEGQIRAEHALEALRHHGDGFRLTFQEPSGTTRDVHADFVVLALPFTKLREVALDLDLPDLKRKAINELGYGTNAKLHVGTTHRPWREMGFNGTVYSDAGYQNAWDSSQGLGTTAGAITFFLGGTPGLQVGRGSAEYQADRLMPGLEKAFPGVGAVRNGNVLRSHWPTNPFTLGSYACYKPGQVAAFSGVEGEPVGHLFFAGEHTSVDFQGYMNGGAETGRLAAEGILEKMSAPRRKAA